LYLVTEQADDEIAFPPERWAATFGHAPSSSSTNSTSISATRHRRCRSGWSKAHRRSTNDGRYYKKRSLPLRNRGV